MRAVICESFDGIEALRVGDFPDPQPSPGTVLIRVEAATVSFADTLMVSGKYQLRPDLPFVPGVEVAGVVEKANDVAGFASGDRVAAFMLHGALAEKAVALESNVIGLPSSVSTSIGATLPVAYGTSYHALVDRGRLEPGEVLLVLGAAGGVGMAAVEIGKALGSTVIAAVSSEEKAAAVRQAGADEVIRYDEIPLRGGIRNVAGNGVDVVYDPVGGDATEEALRSTNWNGRLLVVGFASGTIPKIPINLNLVKGNSVVGVFWGRFTVEEPEQSKANNETIIEMINDGLIRPSIQRTFSLDRAGEALQWVAERKAIGRVLVSP